jgi:hypothetical protein
MPDDELMALAARGELRKNYAAQVKRLMSDERAIAMVRNFTGQWLQLRDVEGIAIDARMVLARDNNTEKELAAQIAAFRARQFNQQPNANAANPATPNAPNGNAPTVAAPKTPVEANKAAAGAAATPAAANGTNPPAAANANGQPAANAGARGFGNGRRGFGPPPVQLDGPLRNALRSEPELLFETIVREDRPLSELLDCNYTFVNANLAKLYGIEKVVGPDMQRVELPKDSARGGLLTMGSLLVVTSNPTRTSPVKRGQFILDNILGMPAPPPPPDIPPLEDAANGLNHDPTFREVLELHRDKQLCKSCHSRMDPLGLSLENFNALGMYRTRERGQAIDASGQLLTGEKFKDVRELKEILVTRHLDDFYRCLTEKMLTYALGRGLEYYDVETVDRIVDRLKKENGRASVLISGIVESAPFQEKRNFVGAPERKPAQRAQLDVHP